MDKNNNKNVKNPIIAIVLSALLPGLGQIYNSQVSKGLFFIGLNMLINFLIKEPLVAVMKDFQSVDRPTMIVFIGYFIAGSILWIYSIVDAKQNSDRLNEEAKNIIKEVSYYGRKTISSHSKNNPLTLIGKEIKVGDKAPDFKAMEGLGNFVSLSTFKNKVKVFNVVISIDTPVCDVQTKRFNSESSALADDVEIMTVSMDLPFAQNRHCENASIKKLRNISDYMHASFGESYGVLIKENRLLARAVFVIDKDDIVRYVEYVKEISEEPNYDAALEVIKSLM